MIEVLVVFKLLQHITLKNAQNAHMKMLKTELKDQIYFILTLLFHEIDLNF